MEYYIATFLGGIILCILGIIFQKIVKQPISSRSLLRDFLVGISVVAGMFYTYPDALIKLDISSISSNSSDLDLQIG
jgi:hypothetical protein